MTPRAIARDRERRSSPACSLRGGVLVATALLAAACSPLSLPPAEPAAGEWTVDSVIDGDTIDVAGPDGGAARVRLLGINTPEVEHEDAEAQCGGEAAADRLAELLPEGTAVQLVADSRADAEDRYGRLLRYVETDAGDAGATLVSEGYAYAWTPAGEPDPDRMADYETATAAARAAGAGAWSDCPDLDESR